MTTTSPRPVLAVAAALVAALALTTSASAAPAADSTLPIPNIGGFEPQGAADRTVPGVTRTTWIEKEPENRTRGRVLQIVEIDPSTAPVNLASTIGTGDGLVETVAEQLAGVSSVAARHPVAGVNGGLFKSEPRHKLHTKPVGAEPETLQHVGVAVTDGVLHSSSCWRLGGAGTSGAVIQYGVPYITKLRTDLGLKASDGATTRLDDINRDPGRARGCARDEDDRRVSQDIEETSKQKGIYTDPDEIVLFTDDYEFPVPKPDLDPYVTTEDDKGFEVVLDSQSKVTAAREGRGGSTDAEQVMVPAGGRILQGIREGADWLRAHAVPGSTLEVDQKLIDTRFDREIPLEDPSLDVVSSFHQVLRDGSVPNDSVDTCNQWGPGKTEGTEICTDSRVALGTNVHGRTVFATLTGQVQKDDTTTHEDGATLGEFAKLLDSDQLGLIDMLNLDGGGSATLMTGKTTHTPPTDRVGGRYVHRDVADAVYAGVGGYGLKAR